MMSKHTAEPWSQETPHDHLVIDGAGYLAADCARPEDARRIVACVNACEGISTEQLDSWASMGRPILQSLKELKDEADREAEQCDALFDALLTAIDHIDMAELDVSHCKDAARIRDAVAKATGGES